ncbi:MAG: rhodanese-like domain-containing protein [Planctomycetota bacterium]|nr:rhodanese-like domain-containing protein [Planctomycetota bacterium]
MKRMLSVMAAVGLVAALGFISLAGDKVEDISLEDLKKAIADKKVTLIDVNGTDSYKKGHLPGAVDFASVKDDLAKSLPAEKDALIVAYCGSPQCPAYKQGANAALKLGYTNVKHYAGGLKGWTEAGEKLEAAE